MIISNKLAITSLRISNIIIELEINLLLYTNPEIFSPDDQTQDGKGLTQTATQIPTSKDNWSNKTGGGAKTLFDENQNTYSGSFLQGVMEKEAEICAASFEDGQTPEEKLLNAGVIPSNLDDAEITDQYLFPLSVDEANLVSKINLLKFTSYWWLRSPGMGDYGTNVDRNGEIATYGVFPYEKIDLARPALQISLDTDIFMIEI